MRIDADTFATKSGLEAELLARMSELGLLPALDRLEDGYIPVARLAAELERSGVSLDELAKLVSRGSLALENIGRAFTRNSGMRPGSFEGLGRSFGVSESFADEIRTALGVPGETAADSIREDDAELLRLLAEMVGLGVPEQIVADLFQVMAENTRRMTQASSEMWAAGVQQPLIDSGMSYRDLVSAQSLNGDRLQAIGVEVVSSLWSRFLDDEIFSGTIEILELALAEAGLDRVSKSGPPAIGFVDLTAFTAMTDRRGDHIAASGARELRAVIRRTIVSGGGTLVKMLGDGAMLHFSDATAAVICAVELTREVRSTGLPPARFGISAGPLIVRDVDYFGHTVNVAARLVDYARPDEVLVTEAVVESVDDPDITFSQIGPVSLKGIANPVTVFSTSSTGASI